MSATYDEFDLDGNWRGSEPRPFDIGDRVREDESDRVGTVTDLGYADDYPFRVTYDDGSWRKHRTFELVKV